MNISEITIQQQILLLRGKQTLLDRDLAKIYQVDTKVLNQAVKRNINRFPEEFRFQLTKEEFENWKSQFVTSNMDKMGLRKIPYAFTEQGVAMLSTVLRSDIAIQVSIQIMKAFVSMRHSFLTNQEIHSRISSIEFKQQFTDEKVNQLFKALEKNELPKSFGIFYDGEIFDAYKFALQLIKSAKHSIILIDNYVDESTLTMLSNKDKNVKTIIFTSRLNEKLLLTLSKHNEQYPQIELKQLMNSHDRFLIIDEEELYHLGASLKDLGKKWFAFSKMNDLIPELLERLRSI
jgi:hypothetical protein